MGESGAVLAGLAFVLAAVSSLISLIILTHPPAYPRSKMPAVICLLCAAVYIGSFSNYRGWTGQGPSPRPAYASIVPPKNFERIQEVPAASAFGRYSIDAVMQHWSH